MNWQPIETAPKDRELLIWRGRPCIARWDDQRYHKTPRPFWNDYGVFGVVWMRDNPPTHWMPLPEPPTE